MGGIPYQKIEHMYFTGTTCATANTPAAVKKIIPDEYKGAYRNKIANLNGQGVYLYGADPERDGVNFPVAITAGPAVQATYLASAKLTNTLTVYAYADNADGEDGKCFAVVTSGNTPTVSSAYEFEDGGVTDVAITRLSDTTFAVAYYDVGDSSYLKAVIGTVTVVGQTSSIAYGTIKSTAVIGTATKGIGICQPRSGIVFIAFQVTSGTDGSTICIPFTGTTFSTQTSEVEFDQTAPDYISCCSYDTGYAVIVYRDTGDSNKIHAWGASVSAAGVVSFGTEKTLVDAAGTVLKVTSPETMNIVVSYIDASDDAALIATTVNEASPVVVATGGSVITPFGAGTHTGVSHSFIDNTQGIVIADDGTYLKAIRFSKAAKVLTADAVIDTAIEGRYATLTACECSTTGNVVIVGRDASNVFEVVVGSYFENRIIDVRSSSTSATYTFDVVPVFEKELSN